MFLNKLADMKAGVAVWLVLYGLLWTLLPLASNAGLPVDVVEIVAWGKEWLVGLYRHPPMKAWLMEIAYQSTGGWLGSPYLLSALAFAVAQLALYAAIRDVRSRSIAFAAVILSALVVYFGVHLPQWNANIAQLPFAALFVLAIWRALDRGSYFWWMVTGAAAAGGFLAKYSFALIPLSVAVVVLVDPWMRQRLRIAPAVAGVLVTVALITPNLLWLLNNPEAMQASVGANSRLSDGGNLIARILSPLTIIGVTIAVSTLPAIAVIRGLVGTGLVSDANAERSDKLRLLLASALFGPILATIAIAIATGISVKDHWLIVNFLFVPGWLLLRFRGQYAEVEWSGSGAVFVVATIAVIAFIYPAERWSHYWFANGKPVSWTPLMPGEPLALAAKNVWREGLEKAGLPLDTPVSIAGGGVQAATVANLLPERPHWFEHLDPRLSPWVAENEVRNAGVLVVGPTRTPSLKAAGLCPFAETDYQWFNGRGGDGMTVHIAAFLPAENCPARD